MKNMKIVIVMLVCALAIGVTAELHSAGTTFGLTELSQLEKAETLGAKLFSTCNSSAENCPDDSINCNPNNCDYEAYLCKTYQIFGNEFDGEGCLYEGSLSGRFCRTVLCGWCTVTSEECGTKLKITCYDMGSTCACIRNEGGPCRDGCTG